MPRKYRSLAEFAEAVADNPSLAERLSKDPVGVVTEAAKPAFYSDKIFYRIIVIGLLGVVITALVFAGLATEPEGPNQVVTALGTTALGAIAGLLAPIRQD